MQLSKNYMYLTIYVQHAVSGKKQLCWLFSKTSKHLLIAYYQIGLVNLLINSKPVGVPNISYFLRETQLSQNIYH